MHYQLHRFLRLLGLVKSAGRVIRKPLLLKSFSWFDHFAMINHLIDFLWPHGLLKVFSWNILHAQMDWIEVWGFYTILCLYLWLELILKGASLYPHVDDLQMGFFVLFKTWLTVWFLIFLHNEVQFVIQILWLDPQLLDLFLSWLQKSLFHVFPICLPFISLFLNSWMVLLIWNMMWWCIAGTTTSTYGYTEHDTASLYSLCEAQHVKQAWTLWKHCDATAPVWSKLTPPSGLSLNSCTGSLLYWVQLTNLIWMTDSTCRLGILLISLVWANGFCVFFYLTA